MIRVVRIAGESFDFDTRQELPKALVLSNGKREYSLYVDDETAQVVLEMMLETVAAPKNGSVPNTRVPTPERPVVPKTNGRAQPVEHLQVDVQLQKDPPPMATVEHDDTPEEDSNAGFEPGEEYNDPATGAESL